VTTRDQVRRAIGAERGDARPPAGDFAPGLPERLLAARERKGVDLYRAERDTKIRARYLAALERGDYRELPGAVYTKGFLRNYALYLGLDPDEILLQWRRERGDPREPQAVISVPQPIAAPRRGLTFSPSLIVFAILVVLVLAFGVYLSVQLLRFAKPPTIAVTDPAVAVLEVDEATTSYVLRGTSSPKASVSIATPGRDPYPVKADADGEWTQQVELQRGRNQFEVSAVDPETGKTSETSVSLIITVPFLEIEAPTLTVDQPADSATYENGAIPVQGRATNAASVVVSAAYTGPARPRRHPRPQHRSR
jgi:cytoskeletal protein RodZ